MRKIFVSIVFFLLIGFLVFTSQKDNKTDLKLKSPLKRLEASPYTVEALRQREYKGGEIKIEKDLGNQTSVRSYVVSYPSDNLKIYALMNVPNGLQPAGGFPVLILNHGYVDPASYSTEESYRQLADYYSTQGFLVLKPDYRAHGDSEGERVRVLNRVNYAVDVLNLIGSVDNDNIEQANPNKIVMVGHSMGGEVALRVIEITDGIKGVSLWAPAVTQFPESFLYFIRKNRPQDLDELQKEVRRYFKKEDYKKISSIDNLEYIKTPIIIQHGTADESVPYSWGEDLSKKLTEKNIRHEFYSYPGEDHNFRGSQRDLVLQRDLEFFREVLK